MLLLPVILLWVSHRKDMPRNKWEVPCHLWWPQETVFTSNWTDRAPWPCAWGDILESCSPWALGTEHSRLGAGQAHPTQHQGWAEPCQADPSPAPRTLPGVLSWPHTAAVALLAHLCPGATAVPGSQPHLGEASLALFQSQDQHHHHPTLHRNQQWQHWKRGKGAELAKLWHKAG